MKGEHTYEEIKGQGDAWSLSLKEAENQRHIIDGVIKQSWPEVIFAGCGSTYYLSLSAAARWQTVTKIRARGVPGSEAWLYPDSVFAKQPPLLVAISRSGETTETKRAIKIYKDRYNLDPVVVSCYSESEMMSETHYPFLAAGGKEQSVAQTRSYTSMLIMTQILVAIAAEEDKNIINNMYLLPNAFDKLVSNHESEIKAIAQEQKFQKFVFLGSGVNYGIACEATLKMKEMSLSVSEAFHFLEFRHGPKSMVADDMLIIALINDSTRNEELKVLSEMKEYGAAIVAIAETGDGIKSDYLIELKSGVDVNFRGPLYLPALQLLAYYRALEKNLDPDNPTNLSTVVELDD